MASTAKRLRQAKRAKETYDTLTKKGERYVAVTGDFKGTFGSCSEKNKFDYILLSPELFKLLRSGGICRLGMWAGVRPKKWETFKEVVRPEDAASDHAAIWAEIDL